MSRGLGKWQRQILKALGDSNREVVLVDLLTRSGPRGGVDKSWYAALYRAALLLEEKGTIVITRQRSNYSGSWHHPTTVRLKKYHTGELMFYERFCVGNKGGRRKIVKEDLRHVGSSKTAQGKG